MISIRLESPKLSAVQSLESERVCVCVCHLLIILYSRSRPIFYSLFSYDVTSLRCHGAKYKWRAGSDLLHLESTIDLILW